MSGRLAPGILLLSAATLALEITLTRVFAVAQWHHYAFMIVSVALLGFGASGTFLLLAGHRLAPGSEHLPSALAALALLFAVTALGSGLAVNLVPFDAFRIGFEARQVGYLVALVLVLSAPFFAGGSAVGLALSRLPARAGAANLVGSGLGCLLAFAVLPLGEARAVLASALVACLAALVLALPGTPRTAYLPARSRRSSAPARRSRADTWPRCATSRP
jgi:hypothetical protein